MFQKTLLWANQSASFKRIFFGGTLQLRWIFFLSFFFFFGGAQRKTNFIVKRDEPKQTKPNNVMNLSHNDTQPR
jgi:hypothetical protein